MNVTIYSRTVMLSAALLAVMHGADAPAQDPKAVILRAIEALHAQDVQSLTINGRGFDALLGQSFDGEAQWPRFSLTRYSYAVSYKDGYSRDDRIRVQVQNPPLGGGNQPIGEQRQTEFFHNGSAWNLGQQGKATLAGKERDQRPAAAARQLRILFNPQGFLTAALNAATTVRTESGGSKTKTILSFTTPDHLVLEGTLDEQQHLERVRTFVGTPILGDVVLDVTFSGYKDFAGVVFPEHVIESEGGYPLLDLTVTSVKANSVESLNAPEDIKQPAATASTTIEPQKYGEGIWILPGANYHASKSILVEFKDYLLVVEAPDSEERSIAVIDAVHKLIPNKPIRYLVNTHTHFDHAGGSRTYVAEGAAIVAWEGDIAYYHQLFSTAHTIHPDRLSVSKRQPVFEGVVGNRTFTDGHQEVVVVHYPGNFHSAGMLAIYLPRQRALIEADSFNPQPDSRDAPTAIPNLVEFYSEVKKLGLTVDEIIPIHGRITPFEEGLKDIEAYKDSQLWQ